MTNGMLAPQIIIRPDDPGRGISRHAMSFDIDNAEQLVRLIDRALSNAEWISSRTEALKSTK
ncbi:MAG: hypothetical protein E1N59_2848 [Puniceicoccaceae bacterium 5H]|nr:MAG: hypothetical protein E1N59_2848 [Puniceicoccaceae bacterium 5H]